MIEQTQPQQNLRAIANHYFAVTKSWWAYSWYCKFAGFAIGLIAVIIPQTAIAVLILVAIVSFASEVCILRSNKYKGLAETFQRKLDFRNAFGWAITQTEIADAVVLLPNSLAAILSAQESHDEYFASREPIGWRRAMHNLQESAWWSKHLARKMSAYCFVVTVSLAVLAVLILLFSWLMIQITEQSTSIPRVVTAVLLLIVSLGLIQLTMSYNTFSQKAEAAERQATLLLQSSADETIQAIKAVNEYHLARTSAPLIPSRLWERERDKLNIAWEKFVNDQRQ